MPSTFSRAAGLAALALLAGCGGGSTSLAPIAGTAEPPPPAVADPRPLSCREASPVPAGLSPSEREGRIQSAGLELSDALTASNFKRDFMELSFDEGRPHVQIDMRRRDYDRLILDCARRLGIEEEVEIRVRRHSARELNAAGIRLAKAIPHLYGGRYESSYGGTAALQVRISSVASDDEIAEIREAAEDLGVPVEFELAKAPPRVKQPAGD